MKIKCVVVGDSLAGKSCLQFSYTHKEFLDYYIPTVSDCYVKKPTIKDQPIILQLWDTSGQDEFKKKRSFSYSNIDVAIICFSLVSRTSLERVATAWVPEIQELCPGTPYILVGLKSDLRDGFFNHIEEYKSNGWTPIPYEVGEEMSKKINAQCYIECSALKNFNVNEVFESAVIAVLNQHTKSKEKKSSNGKKKVSASSQSLKAKTKTKTLKISK